MKTQRGFFTVPVLLSILAGVVILGAAAHYVLKQQAASEPITEVVVSDDRLMRPAPRLSENQNDMDVRLGDHARIYGAIKIVDQSSVANDGKESIRLLSQTGTTVNFLLSVNSNNSCGDREYKIELGDGTIDWLGIAEQSCERKVLQYTYTYEKSGTYTAVLHETTDLVYHEPAFNTSAVSNPVSSVTVQIQ